MDGLNPDELIFMGTPEGQATIARAKREHDYRESWKGPEALGWSVGHIAAAVRAGFLEHQRRQFAVATERAGEPYQHGEVSALRSMRNAAAAAGGRNVR
jgi:hypothetical protein